MFRQSGARANRSRAGSPSLASEPSTTTRLARSTEEALVISSDDDTVELNPASPRSRTSASPVRSLADISGFVSARKYWESQTRDQFDKLNSDRGEVYCDAMELLGGDLYVGFHKCSSARWISSLYVNVLSSKVEIIRRELRSLRGSTDVYAAIWHPEDEQYGHLHVYHTCRSYKHKCRCYFISAIDLAVNEKNADCNGRICRRLSNRSRRQQILHGYNVDPTYVFNWLQYYLGSPRRFIYLEIPQVPSSTILSRLQALDGFESITQDGPDECMEARRLPSKVVRRELFPDGDEPTTEADPDDSTTREPVVGGSGALPRGGEEPPTKLKKRLTERKYIVANMLKILAVPLNACCDTRAWMQDPYLSYYDKTDDDYKRAVLQLQRYTCLLDFDQLDELHHSTSGFYLNRMRDDYYYSYEETLKHIRELLQWQTFLTPWTVDEFVYHVHLIMERYYKKRNTLFIHGPPNSGKTWFADFLSSYYLNVGQVGNFNRFNMFPLNDCHVRRVLVWNEPNIEPSAFDTVKMLCGGDPLAANIKYQSGVVIDRTPVIMTSNKQIFIESEPVWSTRISFFQWKECPYLAKCTRYPHPVAWADLVKSAIANLNQSAINKIQTMMQVYTRFIY